MEKSIYQSPDHSYWMPKVLPPLGSRSLVL